MTRLPASIDELRGRRAARWIRESTAGQYDRFGPESQHRSIDEFIARHGLVDTGLVWTVAQSGRTVWRSPAMAAMLEAAAGGTFDVLLTGYFDRWQRNLRRTLELVEDGLHPAGVAWVMCDRRLMSSDRRDWDQMITEAHEAERYSRRLGERIADGYSAKIATKRDPGGRPPFGFRRNAAKLVEPDPDRIETVRRAFALALEGRTDREIAARVELPLFTVRGILTSPLYVGRLRDGGSANWPPVVDVTTWNAVAEIRAARSRRSPGRPETRRTYFLPMLECDACGRGLVGDKDRYRHLEACDAFMAAAPQPERSGRGQHRRIPGASYRREEYEAIVPFVLDRIRLGAGDVAAAIAKYHAGRSPEPDRLAVARISRERDRAAMRFVRDRDTSGLEATMARLDDEERQARATKASEPVPPAELRRYLEHLPAWWAAVGENDRRALAETLFRRIRVLGVKRAVIEPTAEAIERGIPEAFGLDEVEMVGARGVATSISISSPELPPAIVRSA